MIVGTTPMIAIPGAAFMGSVAMIVGPAPQIRCNDFGRGCPMIAIPTADDCGSLQLLDAPDGASVLPAGKTALMLLATYKCAKQDFDARPAGQ